jgi:hypothetical protein
MTFEQSAIADRLGILMSMQYSGHVFDLFTHHVIAVTS